MSNTFYFNGASASSVGQASPTIGSNTYVTSYIQVSILYGTYGGASSSPAPTVPYPPVEPINTPVLPAVSFNAKLYRVSGGVDSTPALVCRQDIFSGDNSRVCLGTSFTFQTRTMLSTDTSHYYLVWSTEAIEVPYGADRIVINGLNGTSSSFTPS